MNYVFCFGIYRTDTNHRVRSGYLCIKTDDIESFIDSVNGEGNIDEELQNLFERECRLLESTMAESINVEPETLSGFLSWTLPLECTGKMSDSCDYVHTV